MNALCDIIFKHKLFEHLVDTAAKGKREFPESELVGIDAVEITSLIAFFRMATVLGFAISTVKTRSTGGVSP